MLTCVCANRLIWLVMEQIVKLKSEAHLATGLTDAGLEQSARESSLVYMAV